jgi:ferrous iron transport protein B
MDEVRANGAPSILNFHEFAARRAGWPIFPLPKTKAFSELVNQALAVAKKRIVPCRAGLLPGGPVHRCIHAVCACHRRPRAQYNGVSKRFCATKLIEGDVFLCRTVGSGSERAGFNEHSVLEMENETGFDRNEALRTCGNTFMRALFPQPWTSAARAASTSAASGIDKILTANTPRFPVFFGLMFLVSVWTFNVIGSTLADWLTAASAG